MRREGVNSENEVIDTREIKGGRGVFWDFQPVGVSERKMEHGRALGRGEA